MPEQPRPVRIVDARTTKTAGLLIAGALTLVVGVVLVAAFTRAGPARKQESAEALVAPADPGTVAASPARRPGEAPGDVRDVVQASEDGRIELFDERGGLAQALMYERFEPLEASRFRVEAPRALLFLRGGRLVEVRANSAQYVQRRAKQEPESGWFRGDVRITMYGRPRGEAPAAHDADAMIGADRGPALVEMTCESIDFDLATGEVRTPDAVVVRSRLGSDALSFAGAGLTMLLSERDRRLLFLKIEKGDHLTFSPDAAPADDGAREAPAPSDVVDETTSDEPARKDSYRAEFAGPVRVEAGSSVIESDALDVWARLVGGALPVDAVLQILPEAKSKADWEREGWIICETPLSRSLEPQPEPAPIASDAGPLTSARPRDPVKLTWTGALTIRPTAAEPEQLERDDLYVRFASPRRGVVRFEDSKLLAEAEAATAEYGLRSRLLTLAGLGPRGAMVRMKDGGEAFTSRIEVDLGAGVASFPGPGSLTAIGKALTEGQTVSDGARDISWRGRADIEFGRSRSGGALALRGADFSEDVRAREGAMLLTGDSVRAEFDEDDRGRPQIRRVIAEGRAMADAVADGRVSADRLDVAFIPVAGRAPAPSIATATGSVKGERDGSTLRAELVETTFTLEASGRARVETFSADLGVAINSGEGANAFEARADRLRSRPGENLLELIGAASLAQRGATLRGDSMRILGGESRTITVFGAGSAERTASPGDDRILAVDHMLIEWQGVMTYDDITGKAECTGGVVATATHGPLERHEARGEQLVAMVTPWKAPREGAEPALPANAESTEQRELLHVTLLGASEVIEGGAKARIESRRFVEDAASENGLRLVGLVYLDADRFEADAKAGTFGVPGPGRLLLEDRRTMRANAEANAGGAEPASVSRAGGTTLTEWTGSLVFHHAEGRGEIVGGVRSRHLPQGETQALELESERLTVRTGETRETLREAEALGAVFARRGGRQLTGDRMLYRDVNGARTAEISAAPGNMVTTLDDATGQTHTARAVVWDLDRDRVRATEASPITAPR